MTHRTVPVVGAAGDVLSQETFSVLQEYDGLKSIHPILLDNTTRKAGWKSGLAVKLE